MQTLSRWENTPTLFRQFRAALSGHLGSSATVVVIGASDGRLVLPLAAAGHRVIAIERDPDADLPLAARYDAVWTSCSWHYSANHPRPHVGQPHLHVHRMALLATHTSSVTTPKA